MSAGGLWIGIHEIPWLGPALADGTRAVVGPTPVAWAENITYGIADWVNVRARKGEKPKTFWEAPPAQASAEAAEASSATADGAGAAPTPFMPPFEKVAAEGDGLWIPAQAPSDVGPPSMWKTLVHPDARRPFAAVAVVAMSRETTELHLIAGTDEPKSEQVRRADRPGLVPQTELDGLIAAFNGGFKAMHGNYGMRIGEQTFVSPRGFACSICLFTDGSLAIRTHTKVESSVGQMLWLRQTPPCLVEQGASNPMLSETNKNWGATVGGDTIIRRSAVGLSRDGRHLFYAIGDAVTAQSIGRALEAAGAYDAAQLDVNYSYPRFLLFEKGEGGTAAAASLIPDVKYSPTEYVQAPSPRDFFYVTKKRQAS